MRFVAALLGMSVCAACAAGPLTPPPGPVAPTGKTLAQVEAEIDAALAQAIGAFDKLVALDPGTPIESLPGDAAHDFIITQPGYYFLSNNYVGDGANTVIDVRASNVVIDLRGFFISADAFFNGANARAVDTTGGVDNVVIRNGTITLFGDSGGGAIRLNGDGNLLEDVRVSVSQGSGIVAGSNSILRRCVAFGCVEGIRVGDGSSLVDCIAVGHANDGFVLNGANTAYNCAADDNGGAGFNASDGSTLSNCTATRNGGDGFDCIGTTLVACAAYANDADGFDLVNSRASFCAASNNFHGFRVRAGNHVTRCSATNNDSGGFLIEGIRSHIANNHSADHLGVGEFGYRLTPAATEVFFFGNFGEDNALFYDFQTADTDTLGDRKIDLINATIWDNFSN